MASSAGVDTFPAYPFHAPTMIAHLIQLSRKPQVPGEYGLPKTAVAELRISPAGAEGDYNNYRTRTLHDDPDQAIMLITEEVLAQLRTEGWPVEPGHFGENLTLGGVREADLGPGCSIRLGAVTLEISKPCDPCTELSVLPYVGTQRQAEFIRTTKGRRGWYARVLTGGTITLQSPVIIHSMPRQGVPS